MQGILSHAKKNVVQIVTHSDRNANRSNIYNGRCFSFHSKICNQIRIILHAYHSHNLQMSFTYHTVPMRTCHTKMIGIFQFLNIITTTTTTTTTSASAVAARPSRWRASIWLNKQQISIRDGFIKNISFRNPNGMENFRANKFVRFDCFYMQHFGKTLLFSRVNHERKW